VKSKKWLISLGLAVALVVAFALPACNGGGDEPGWYTPEGDLISFDISTTAGYSDMSLMVANDLQDFGFDINYEVLDSTTFYEYLYEPNLGGMDAFIAGDDPSPDPWSDWIWIYLSDPEDWGYMWNPCWYNDDRYNELWVENYLAPNLSAKQAILFEMQEILAQDVPIHWLVRADNIGVVRTDNWENWFPEMGGQVSWLNEWSIREVTAVDDATQLNLGDLIFMPNLYMDQEVLMYTNIGCLYLMLVYENLSYYAKIDQDLGDAYDFVPKLATNYTVTYEDDGTDGQNQVWTINLREDVKWHDYNITGEMLDADDLVYTVQYVTNKWGVNKPVNWTAVEENEWEILPEHMLATKTGEHQVEFRFVEGWHQNEDFFPSVYCWDAVVPKHKFVGVEDPLVETGDYIGTGPYMVKEWEPDSYLLLERFDDYWGPLPEPQQVLFKMYADTGALFLALEGGEIDGTLGDTAPPAKVATYQADPDLQVDIWPALTLRYLGFNLHPDMGYEPLQDVVLRRAIAYAIDKQDIVDVALGGYGEVCYSWTYNESPYLNPDLTKYDYDTTAAESILLDAGYTYVE